MKLTTLIIIGLLGASAWRLWTDAPQSTAALNAQKVAPAPKADIPTRAQTLPVMPGTLRNLIGEGGEARAMEEWKKYLRTAQQMELHGTVRRHLEDGHVVATADVMDPKVRVADTERLLLFGLPEADRMADGDIFDCFAVAGDVLKGADGEQVREYVWVDPAGRSLPRYERSAYP